MDKRLIDKLHRLDVKVVTVRGTASPVGYDIGTSLMVALIFLALVAALTPVLWRPFQALLEKRKRELEIAAEAARNNQREEARLAEDRAARNAQLAWDIQAKKMAEQQRTAREVDAILKEARANEKEDRRRDLLDINTTARQAEQDLESQVAGMAEEIARTILGRDIGKNG